MVESERLTMSDELMAKFAPKVARFFPVVPGETLKAYTERAKATFADEDRRAMIAAYLCKASEEVVDERAAKRRSQRAAWIASARLRFFPGPRRPCAICEKYVSLTEAHYIVPLALQFEAGAVEPIQEFQWLCPTHHAAEHVIIRALLKIIQPDLEGVPIEERDALGWRPEAGRFVKLFHTLPRAHTLYRNWSELEAYLRHSVD
jgi:hypothetical protein